MSELRTSIIINLTGNLDQAAARYGRTLEDFSRRGQRNLGLMTRAAHQAGKALEAAGSKYAAVLTGGAAAWKSYDQAVKSAKLDKQLIQIAQTAGATIAMAKGLRAELHTMSQQTGQSLDDLLEGFNNLVQSGQTWEQSLATIKAINPALAVTGAKADTLASALTVAGEAFKFDLSKLETSKLLLDQMTVAGRLGNAELQDLSGIFARVGVNAKGANLSFAETLGFIEQLSLIERQPERLATLADSTLRLFTNQQYLKKAAKATGVSFYDKNGGKRAAFDVLQDIARQYQNKKTDMARDQFLAQAFQGADLDTIRGLKTLLSGDALFKVRGMAQQIEKAGGTIARDLPQAVDNATDQVGRLKAALRQAADGFAQPVNDAVNRAIKYLMDDKKLTGKEMLAGGAAATAAALLAARYGGKALSGLGGAAAGVAAGKALEQFAGVTPVYVVNMPGGGAGGLPGIGMPGGIDPKAVGGWRAALGMLLGAKDLGSIRAMGVGAMGTSAGLVAASGAVGYGAGTLANNYLLTNAGPLGTRFGEALGDQIGYQLNKIAAALGSEESQQAIAARLKEQVLNGTIKLEVSAPPGVSVRAVDARTNSGVGFEVDRGLRIGGGL